MGRVAAFPAHRWQLDIPIHIADETRVALGAAAYAPYEAPAEVAPSALACGGAAAPAVAAVGHLGQASTLVVVALALGTAAAYAGTQLAYLRTTRNVRSCSVAMRELWVQMEARVCVALTTCLRYPVLLWLL